MARDGYDVNDQKLASRPCNGGQLRSFGPCSRPRRHTRGSDGGV